MRPPALVLTAYSQTRKRRAGSRRWCVTPRIAAAGEGYVPALSATRIDPAVALREE
jgi:hypothetical protein